MRTIVVGPSSRMQGGITTVIRTQEQSVLWSRWGCTWIGTTLSRSMPWKLLWLATALARYARHLPLADLVHIHFTDGISARRKSLFFHPALWMRKPVVLHFHAPSFEESEAAARFAPLARMFRGASRVVVLSRNWAELVTKHVPGTNVRVVRNAVAAPAAVQPMEGRANRIVYAGILNGRKGYRDLVEAFAKIAPDFPDWTLVLAGDGEVEWARNRVLELGLRERVDVPGWMSRSAVLDLMGTSAVFCLPSLAEGFPMTVLEAFANGCAVVTTPVGGLAEELRDGEDLVFVRPSDIASLRSGLIAVMSSLELRRELSLRARELTRTRYGIEASMASLDAVYREVTS